MRKNTIAALLLGATFAFIVYACKKDGATQQKDPEPVPQDVIAKIKALGFSSSGVRAAEGGWLVEGDILLTAENLSEASTSANLRIAETEQYRTNNLVKSLPRQITVKVMDLGPAFVSGADLAIARYNAQNLQLTFRRITSGKADITIKGFYQGPSGGFITLGSAGFPTRNGNPYGTISMNTHEQAYGANPNVDYVGSVIQHEMGHCIGFRHTDYMDRAFSCGASGAGNEGASNVGAVHIPGTPTGPDAASWMLACSNGGNRTFNANDIVALNYLY